MMIHTCTAARADGVAAAGVVLEEASRIEGVSVIGGSGSLSASIHSHVSSVTAATVTYISRYHTNRDK